MDKIIERISIATLRGNAASLLSTHTNPSGVSVTAFLLVICLAEGLTNHLRMKRDFDQKFHYILSNEILPDKEEIKSSQVVSDLRDTLNKKWPGTVVTPFGSIVSRLALKTSDIDLFATIPGYNDTNVDALVMDILDLLTEQPELYTEIRLTTSGNIIISFLHVSTQRHGDLCLKAPSIVSMSYLLRYMMNLDTRIREVMIFLKFWCKTHRLINLQKLRSYAVYFLVLFYFQQKHMLPALAQIQENSTPIIMHGYNFGYNEIPFHSCNIESIYELLGGFFKYYREFDFDNFFVSPYVGRPVSKRDFKDVMTIPAEFTIYKQKLKENTTKMLGTEPKLVIQDAFLHSNNVARVLGTNDVHDEIISYIKRAADIFDKFPPEKVLCELLRTNSDVEISEEKHTFL